MFYAFFCVITRRLNFVCRRFGTLSIPVILHINLRMKMEQSVPKRRHIKFRRRGITQKNAYNNIVHLLAVVQNNFANCIYKRQRKCLTGRTHRESVVYYT